LTSDEGEPDDSSDNEDDDALTPVVQPRKTLPALQTPTAAFPAAATIQAPTPEVPTPMPARSNPPSKPPSPGFKVLPKLLRRPTANVIDSATPLTPPPMGERTTSSASVSTTSAPQGKKKRIRSWAPKPGEYDFNASQDVVGIVMLEVKNAEDLPKLKNSKFLLLRPAEGVAHLCAVTRTGWDMDPFVVISFGKKVFRTRVIRHSLNPVWDEKLLFHVRRYEKTFRVQLAVLDWDKISSNDPVGQASFDLTQLLVNVPEKDPETGLYAHEEDGGSSFTELTLELQSIGTTSRWESKHSPKITVR
jgi:phosphatidylserine decarboxylase